MFASRMYINQFACIRNVIKYTREYTCDGILVLESANLNVESCGMKATDENADNA